MTGASRLIDVTLPLSERLPVWPGDEPVRIHRSTGTVTISDLHFSSHAGTHLDAPAHFFPDGRTVDQLPLATLIGPAWVADLTGIEAITAETLERAGIPEWVERVLLKTRNSGSTALLAGPSAARRSVPFDESYVALDASAGNWLLGRRMKLVGVDGPSADLYHAHRFPVHRLLLEKQVVIVENLLLAGAQAGAYRLICLPLRFEGGDGAPVRAVLETI